MVNLPLLPGVNYEDIRPYMQLAESIGGLQHVLARAPIRRIAIEIIGEDMNGLIKAMTVGILRGLLLPIHGEKVSYVNAPLLATRRGWQITQAKGIKISEYSNVITCQITLDDGEEISIAGALLDRQKPYILQINDYRIHFEPRGSLLIMGSYDKPGVIGRVGTLIHSLGDRARNTGFPYHYETHGDRFGSYSMPVDYDPSLPPGLIWLRQWRLEGNYGLRIEGRVVAEAHGPADGDDPQWKMYRPGHGMLGLGFGSATLYESFGMGGPNGKAAWIAAWTDDGYFGIREHGSDTVIAMEQAPKPSAGDRFWIAVSVAGGDPDTARLEATLEIEGKGPRRSGTTGQR